MSLTTFVIIHNAVLHDYPLREACRSAAGISDRLLVLAHAGDEDGTQDWCWEIVDEHPQQAKIIVRHWWEPDSLCLEGAVNYCIEQVETDYYLWLPADEVLHEDEAPLLRARIDAGGFDMANLGHLHFWERFDQLFSGKDTTCPFAPLVGRRALYPDLRCANPGADGLGPEYGVPLEGLRDVHWEDDLHLYHYGYLRQGASLLCALAAKKRLAGDLPDPKTRLREDGRLDWAALGVPASELSPFLGTHPAVMRDWIEARR